MSEPTILLDFWGVVGVVQTPADLARMAERIGAAQQPFTEAYWRNRPAYDGGCGTDTYWGRVAADLEVPLDDDAVADLQRLDVRSWSRVDDQMMALIRDLAAADRRLALLSNAPRDLVQHASTVLSELVPQLFFSSELGLVKPQPEIFEAVLGHLAVPADQVIFVDDNLDNVLAARAVGMTGLHHTSVAETRRSLSGDPGT